MLAFANAKINLGLNVTEKRPDGYHNIETVLYPIKLYDVIEIIDAPKTNCVVKGMDVPGDPNDNICIRTYNLINEDFDLPPQQILLLKNIPIGAGLGGGSSDAAFLIKLINNKFKLGLSIHKMQAYSRKLGADCSFFIENKSAYAFGKGDEFSEINIDLSMYYKILVKPPVHIATINAYSNVLPFKPSSALKDLIHLPIQKWKSNLKNDFESSVFLKYPEIEQIKNKLYQAGALYASMSGSGSCLYAIFQQKVELPDLEKENEVFYNI